MSVSSAAPTSMPRNVTDPPAMRPARSRIRMTAYEVTDLPEPDSPTMPTVSPLASEILSRSTARTVPRRVENSTVRSRTSRRGMAVIAASSPALRVDDVAQPIAQKIEAEYRHHQRGAGKEGDPPFARDHEGGALRNHDPPLG